MVPFIWCLWIAMFDRSPFLALDALFGSAAHLLFDSMFDRTAHKKVLHRWQEIHPVCNISLCHIYKLLYTTGIQRAQGQHVQQTFTMHLHSFQQAFVFLFCFKDPITPEWLKAWFKASQKASQCLTLGFPLFFNGVHSHLSVVLFKNGHSKKYHEIHLGQYFWDFRVWGS